MGDFGCGDNNLNGRWKKKILWGPRVKILKFQFVRNENPLIIINK